MGASYSSTAFDEIAPLQGNSPSKRLHYDDVFINHRGSDVKHTLATTIYNSLVDRGLTVFLDSKELELGDFFPSEIEAAMRKASLHIAIFSKNYAKSPWCLAELSFMLQTGKTIVPIFYHVQPTDLRWVDAGRGIYANAFLEHEVKGRYSMEKLVEWKEAVQRVSFISGHIINDNEDEGKLLEDIVEKIALKVKKWPFNTTALFDYTIGIEEAKHKVIRLLKMDLQDESKRAVIVYGVGGIGKTTLATVVFKSLDLEGYKFCRLDMDQDCSTDHIKQLQQQILQDLFGVKLRIPLRSCVEGQDRLTQAFTESNSPIFMYIDNALKASDLEKLLPKDLSNLPRKTRVLVTTRRLDQTSIFVQRDFKRDQFMVECLSPSDSKKLLCKIALGSPNASFSDAIKTLDVDEIVEMCGRIPLVLQLVGSRLKMCGNDTSKIKSYLKESLVEGKGDMIECVVDVVYKSLDELSKEAFLDIVCFYNNESQLPVSCAVGKVQLEALQDAALVKLSVDHDSKFFYSMSTCEKLGDMFVRVNVHDLIRARGKQLSKPHRIMDLESLEEAVQDRQKLKKIKGIDIPSSAVNAPYKIKAKMLDLMHTSLRVLRLPGSIEVNGKCQRSFESLEYVSVHGLLPIDLKKVKRLAVLQGTVADNVAKLPTSLRFITLNDSPKLPRLLQCLDNLSFLEYVDLEGCDVLVTVPASIGQLKCLTMLNLTGCRNLTTLPDSFGDLSALLMLNLSDCCELACLPPTFGKLKSLCFLEMDRCKAIIKLPHSFGNLFALTFLSLSSCSNLLRLPDNFGELKSLIFLHISDCNKLERLKRDFASLTSLMIMGARNCQSLHGKTVDILVKMRSLMAIDISGSDMMMERWEEVRQQYALMVSCDGIKGHVHTAEHTLFHGRSRFVGIGSFRQLVEWSWPSFQEDEIQVAVLLTMCDLTLASNDHVLQRVSEELEKRKERRGKRKFHIVYVEALEKSEKHIRQTLLCLPRGTHACIPADEKTSQLFNFAVYSMLKTETSHIPIESSHTYIVGLRVGVDRDRKWVKFGTDFFPGDYKEEELETRRKDDLQVMTDPGGGLKTLFPHSLLFFNE